MNHLSDPDIREHIQGALKGEEADMRILIDHHKQLVLSIISSWSSTAGEVEDICQEVFLKIFRNLQGFRFRSSFRTWVGRITVNECRTWYRKNKKLQNQIPLENEKGQEQTGTPDCTADDDRYIVSQVQNAVSLLSAQMQTIFRLRFMEEMNSREIGRTLSLPDGTVRSHISTIRKHILSKCPDRGGQ